MLLSCSISVAGSKGSSLESGTVEELAELGRSARHEKYDILFDDLDRMVVSGVRGGKLDIVRVDGAAACRLLVRRAPVSAVLYDGRGLSFVEETDEGLRASGVDDAEWNSCRLDRRPMRLLRQVF